MTSDCDLTQGGSYIEEQWLCSLLPSFTELSTKDNETLIEEMQNKLWWWDSLYLFSAPCASDLYLHLASLNKTTSSNSLPGCWHTWMLLMSAVWECVLVLIFSVILHLCLWFVMTVKTSEDTFHSWFTFRVDWLTVNKYKERLQTTDNANQSV